MGRNSKWTVSLLAGLFFVLGLSQAQAYFNPTIYNEPTSGDPFVGSLEASLDSNIPGATATMEVTVQITEEINNGNVNFNLEAASCSSNSWEECQADFSGAQASLDGYQFYFQENGFSLSPAEGESKLASGTLTFSVSGVVLPAVQGAYYLRASAWDESYNNNPPCGEGENDCDWPNVKSETMIIGSAAIQGTVTQAGGQPVEDVWIEAYTKDGGEHQGASTNSQGDFYIFGLVSGTTYWLQAHLDDSLTGWVAPDPVKLIYQGSALEQNIVLARANKTIKVTVTYNDDGAPVKNASVNAWRTNGEGGMGQDVNSQGVATLLVNGGSWEVSVGPKWQDNQQVEVDWSYNQPSVAVSFSDNNQAETIEVSLVVTRATARLKGSVVKPDGSALKSGWLEIRNTEGQGAGGSIDQGKFSVALSGGTYSLYVWTDNKKFYHDDIKFTISDGEIKDLGQISLKEKNFVVTGKVTKADGTPAEGARVHGWQKGDKGWADSEVDSQGNYELYLSPGNWEVMPDNWGTNYIYQKEPKSVQVADQGSQTINFQVTEADAQVLINVLDSQGRAVAKMQGGAYCRDTEKGYGPGAEFNGGIDRGRATINLIGGRTYECGLWIPPEYDDYSADKVKEVKVAKGETKEVSISLVNNDAVYKIVLKDQFGQKVSIPSGWEEGFEVYVVDEDHNWRPAELVNGHYEAKVVGGKKYSGGWWISPDSKVPYLNSHQEEEMRPVKNGESYTQVMTIFKATTEVTGRVVDPDGQPIAHAWVGASNSMFLKDKVKGDWEGGKVVETGTETREDGTFSLNLVAGQFEIFTGLPPEMNNYLSPKAKVVALKSGESQEVELKFRQADATLELEVSIPGIDKLQSYQGFCWAYSNDKGFSGSELVAKGTKLPLSSGTTWYYGCDYHDENTGDFYRAEEGEISITTGGVYQMKVNLEKTSVEIPDGLTFSFDATSAMTKKLPDGTEIIIPANALSNEGQVTIVAEPEWNIYQSEDSKLINFAWDFEAMNADGELIENFNSEVTIKIPYDEDLLNELGISEDDILPKYFDDNSSIWKETTYSIDKENNVVLIKVNHFTEFAVVQDKAKPAEESTAKNLVVTPEAEGGPQIAVYDKDGQMLAQWLAFDADWRGGLKTATGDLDANGRDEVVAYPSQEGFGPQLRVFDENGQLLSQFFAYESDFTKGLEVKVYDLDGEGEAEIVTVPKNAPADVKVFDKDGNLLARFNAFEGVEDEYLMELIDLTGDGTGEIVMSRKDYSDVKVFDKDGRLLAPEWGAFSQGAGDLELADLNGDGSVEIIMTPVNNKGQIRIMGHEGQDLGQFFAYDQNLAINLQIEAADLDGDGALELVTLPSTEGTAQVRVFDLAGNLRTQFYGFPENIVGTGFEIAAADLDSNGSAELVMAAGEGKGSTVRVLDQDGNALSQFNGLHEAFKGGLNIQTISQ